MYYNPCYKCQGRHYKCHAHCIQGIKADNERKAINDHLKQENERLSGYSNLNSSNARQRTSGHKSAVDIHMTAGGAT